MRSRSRSGGTAVTPSSHRGGTPALQLWLCLFHLVPSCSLENQHIQHFKNLPKPDNQPPAVSRSNHCPLLVVLPALCIQAFVITAASQSKHGPMGPPFSILLGLEKISSGQFHSAADLRMLLDCRNCTACTKGGHWKPPTLTACHWGGSLPQLLPWGNTIKINQARKQWKQFLSNLTELNMVTWSMSMVRYRVLRGAAGCQRSILNCRSPETSGWLQDAASMLSRLSLSLLFPSLGRVSNKKCLLLRCFMQFYTRQKEWSRSGIKPRSRPGPFAA